MRRAGEAKDDVDAQAEVARTIAEFRAVYSEVHEDHRHAEIEEDIPGCFELLAPEAVQRVINRT